MKLMLNSIIATLQAKSMTIDLKDFYLSTPMSQYKYSRMKLDLFPLDVINEYGLLSNVDTNGNVFCEVKWSMYGLPHAGILAQELLTEQLPKAGYTHSATTPGYWKHQRQPLSFTLVVNDFGVKCINQTDAEHLPVVLKNDYEYVTDWNGTCYFGLTIDWNYTSS